MRRSHDSDTNGNIDIVVKSKNDIPNSQQKVDVRTLSILFISLLLDLLGFTVILPLFPSLLDYYGHHDDQGSLYFTLKHAVDGFRDLVGAPDTPRWNSVLFGGVLGSLFSFLQYLTSPVIGAFSDVYGRRPVMILTSVGIAASYAVWAVSHNFTIFVIARIIGGVSKGNVSLSYAIVSDVTPAEKRTKGMAMIGVAFSVGFVVGPLIGAYFSLQARSMDSGAFFVTPALFALSLALINIVFLLFFMRETLPAEKRAKTLGTGFQRAIPLIHPVMLFKFSAVQNTSASELGHVQKVSLVYFLYLFIFSGLEFTLTFLAHNRFDFDSMQQGKMFFFIGVIMILVQGGFVRRVKVGKEISMAIVGLILLIPSFIIVAFAYKEMVLYAGLALFSFASATVPPCLTAIVSSYGTAQQKGTVIGIFRSLGALARSIGPVVASIVYWSLGPVYCYVIGGVSLFIPLVLLTRAKKFVQHSA